ncbi:MAG: hypothetical protein H6934_14090 [Burkholderiaceae bacterium]|nr:hypothetical protein [Burkholderiaceae bacterium]
MNASVSPGLVLVANYMRLDAPMRAFWSGLDRRLRAVGLQLLMLSTTEVEDLPFPVMSIPYHLGEFATRFDIRFEAAPVWAGPIIELSKQADPHSPPEITASGTAVAAEFYSNLFEALRPAAVIGWNAMHPHTQLFVGIARLFGIPAWNAERGWLRDTMMFDLGENTLLCEWGQSVALRSMQARPTADPALFERLRAHYLSTRIGKYAGEAAVDPAAARARLGIGATERVVAAFTHAEPGIHGPAEAVRPVVHDASTNLLDLRLAELATQARAQGAVLLVQEHPINREQGMVRERAMDAGARFVHENPYTLFDLAEVTAHTHSTLQFDSVLVGKPIMLLERTMLELANAPGAYALDEFGSVGAALLAALDGSDWPVRRANLAAFVAAVARHQLIDIGNGIVPQDASALAKVLARYARPAPSDLGERVNAFLETWGLASAA